jgi:hypothetical protein
MSNRSASNGVGSNGFAVDSWNPGEFVLRWNSLAFSACCTIGSEAHDFMMRRLTEDFALMRRLAHCRSQHEIVELCADFWRKASDDYGREATTVATLMINTTSKMMDGEQSRLNGQEVSCSAPLSRRLKWY